MYDIKATCPVNLIIIYDACVFFSLNFFRVTLPCGSQLLTYVSPKRKKFKAKSKLFCLFK